MPQTKVNNQSLSQQSKIPSFLLIGANQDEEWIEEWSQLTPIQRKKILYLTNHFFGNQWKKFVKHPQDLIFLEGENKPRRSLTYYLENVSQGLKEETLFLQWCNTNNISILSNNNDSKLFCSLLDICDRKKVNRNLDFVLKGSIQLDLKRKGGKYNSINPTSSRWFLSYIDVENPSTWTLFTQDDIIQGEEEILQALT